MVGGNTTVQQKKATLSALAELGTILAACKVSNTSRTQYYRWKVSDPDFCDGEKLAYATFGEKLEVEAIRRAHDGVEESVWYRGYNVGTVKKYSDLLLIFLLKGALPDKYRERVEQSGKVEHNVKYYGVIPFNGIISPTST